MSTDLSGGGDAVHSAVRWLLTPVSEPGRQSGVPSVGPEGSGADIEIKKGVRTDHLAPQITRTYPQIAGAWRENDAPRPVITSGNDSAHMRGSLHYQDRAIDLRCNNIPDTHCQRISAALQKSLGPDYDIQFEKFPARPENDHIHVEFDPKAESKSQPKPQSMVEPGDGLGIADWMQWRRDQIGRC